jgi:molybdopterin molybdotransferase
MISPESAQRLIRRHCNPLGDCVLPIADALGYVLAETVRTDAPLPRFDNSAMDGYAVRAHGTDAATATHPVRLAVVDEVFAGQTTRRRLRAGEACRIMTGAPLPAGADAVAQKEEVHLRGDEIWLDHPIAEGRHVRRRGEEIKKSQVILPKGLAIDAGAIGCLATIGRERVRVQRRPSVSVIATGDETVAPGGRLRPSQIYESNSYMVSAALRQMGITPSRVRHVKDHPTALGNAVAASLARSDVLIVTGGVSVGDRDYVRDVLSRQRVREVFWRVRQKPGKPFYFGVRGKRAVFGLPGNPASVFTCFYVHVYTALRWMAGFSGGLVERRLPLATPVTADKERWRLLKAKLVDGPPLGVASLPRQASHMITALTETDSIAVVPPGVGTLEAGSLVTVYLLPKREGPLR